MGELYRKNGISLNAKLSRLPTCVCWLFSHAVLGHVLRASKRVSGILRFRLYALADGIRQFFYSQTKGLKKLLELQNPPTAKPTLFDA